jgi:hypothetical protein
MPSTDSLGAEPSVVSAARASHPECRFSTEWASTRVFRWAPSSGDNAPPPHSESSVGWYMQCPGRPRELLARRESRGADAGGAPAAGAGAAAAAAAALAGALAGGGGGGGLTSLADALDALGRGGSGAAGGAPSAAPREPRERKGIYI